MHTITYNENCDLCEEPAIHIVLKRTVQKALHEDKEVGLESSPWSKQSFCKVHHPNDDYQPGPA